MVAKSHVGLRLLPMNVYNSSAWSSRTSKSRNTCWLKRAAALEARSSHRATVLRERRVTRLWASSVVGRRSSRNTTALLDDVILRGRLVGVPLIATDGFESYGAVIRRLLGPACVYGQVIKTRWNDRVIRVERRAKIGTAAQLKNALVQSEDSEHLNTSFVERLNLTIRQGSAYLRRCSPCHARGDDQLHRHVELLRCHYNFVRPHRALKFGRETRTPAMQAGVASTRMRWSDIFTAPGLSRRLLVVVLCIPGAVTGTRPTVSWPHEQRLAA